MKERIQATLRHIHEITHQEVSDHGDTAPEALSARLEETTAVLEEKIEVLSEQIASENSVATRQILREQRSALKKPLKLLREDYLPRLAKYEQQKACFGDRNSYSKTDPDATFMRMKEDHMKNG
ncbi:hypothetical protein [Rubeoparvulum massiliense]|uniref:hypothetical protein n=1 Tax=Rubeoparvulum massiliense TaxID=1631346 RepID=UPI00069E215F|nr:hypothetical protein [Rubeoparvulum massiliense]